MRSASYSNPPLLEATAYFHTMEFLGIGPAELFFIIIIALIVIGPRDIGKTARTIGRFLNRMYRSETWRTLTQASRNLRNLPNQLAREAALEEIDEIREEIRDTQQSVNQQVKGLQKDLQDSQREASEPFQELDTRLKSWKPTKGRFAEQAPNSETEEPDGSEG